jgi:diguanylate cyclase (GGDEF)-like protein/PAS domain S-box-containing protein
VSTPPDDVRHMANPWRARWRGTRVIGLAVCVCLLAAMCVIGINWNGNSTRSVEDARRTVASQELGDLADQVTLGLQQLAGELARFAAARSWDVTPDSANDRKLLVELVKGSTYFTDGGFVSDYNAVPTSRYTPTVFPSDDDPGYLTMVKGLPIPPMAGSKGAFGLLSSVMTAGDHPVIAVGVLLYRGATYIGSLIGIADLRRLEVQRLMFHGNTGALGEITCFDSDGRIVLSSKAGQEGTRVAQQYLAAGVGVTKTVLQFNARLDGRPAVGFGRGQMPGGWVMVGAVTADQLYASARHRGMRINLALVAMVVFTSLVLVVTSQRADTHLRRSGEQFRALVQNGNDVIAVLDAHGRMLFLSPSQERVLGYPRDVEYRRKRAAAFLYEEDRGPALALFGEVLTEAGTSRRGEFRIRRANGTYLWMDVHFTNMTDSPAKGVVINARDVTDGRELREQLRDQATMDALTGLANRRLLYQRLTEELNAPDRPVAVLYVDLDRFKPVNDRLGHEAGDTLLRHAAERLRRCLRPDDLLARVGGDEFVIVAPDIRPEDADSLARRVVDTLAAPFAVAGDPDVQIGASVGVGFGWAPDLPDELIKRADQAMYRAKEAGGQQHQPA